MLVLIPTYNEYKNVKRIYKEIIELELETDILFIDDNSPDGTGRIIDKLKKTDDRVHAVHRSQKQGVGSAHLEGIKWAYKNNYDILITMDSDFTHSPRDIQKFMNYSKDYEIVIGSRYIKKESLNDWNLFRKTLTYFGHFMTKRFLKIPYDATGAFRLYRLDKINKRCFDQVQSKSYSFFFESLYFLLLDNYSVKEFSIKLPARTYGHSKMSLVDAFNSLLLLLKLYLRKTINKKQIKKP